MIEMIGIIAATITSFGAFPQLVKAYRTKKAEDLSYGLVLFLVIGVSLWLTYGVMINSIPVILESLVSLSLIMAILILKIVYRENQ